MEVTRSQWHVHEVRRQQPDGGDTQRGGSARLRCIGRPVHLPWKTKGKDAQHDGCCLYAQVKEYKADLASLKEQLKQAAAGASEGDAARAELGLGDNYYSTSGAVETMVQYI